MDKKDGGILSFDENFLIFIGQIISFTQTFMRNRISSWVVWAFCNATILLCGCVRSEKVLLSAAENLHVSRPDSALHLLNGIERPERLGAADRAYYGLLTIQTMNRCGLPLPDSLVRETARYYRRTNDSMNRAKACLYLSRLLEDRKEDPDASMTALFEAEDYTPVACDAYFRTLVQSDLGDIYHTQFKDREAVRYYLRALEYCRATGRRQNEALILYRLASAYMTQKKCDSAILCQRAVFDLCEAGEADTPSLLASACGSIGQAYLLLDRLDSAEYYIRRSLSMSDEQTIAQWTLLANLYEKKHMNDSARAVYTELLAAVRSVGDTMRMGAMLHGLSRVEQADGHYDRALDLYRQGAQMVEALQDRHARYSIPEAEKKYRLERLRTEKERLSVHQRNLWLMVSLLGLLLALGVVGYRLAVSRRDRRNLQTESERQKEQIETQRISLRLKEETIVRQQSEIQLQRIRSRFDEIRYLLKSMLEMKRQVNLLVHDDRLPPETCVETLVERFSLTPGSWSEIARIIDHVHEDLPDTVARTYPQLTEDDVRLCVLIIVGLESSEIAQILDINTDSVYRKRRRLKKKIGLGGTESLKDCLMGFVAEE